MSARARVEQALADLRVDRLSPGPVGRLVSARGPFLRASGFRLPVGTGARVEGCDGTGIGAEVVGFDDGEALLMALLPDASPSPGARVTVGRSSRDVAVGSGLLGRVIDATGKPIDGAGPIAIDGWRDARGRTHNPLARTSVTRQFSTGVRAIDALFALGRGQRVILVAGSGVGKSTLVRQIVDVAVADVIVVALIGERSREISDFVNATAALESRTRTITVAVPGDRSPLLRIRGAQRATTIAEYFRDRGQNVLLILDSITRVAHAQRELGLGTGETPTMKGYPPSALAVIPALLERCGNDTQSGGSITALYTVLADGDDNDDPVVDAARAIADGHIVLARSLAEQGVFPAIDIGRSLSRIMNDIVAPEQRAAAKRVRRLWSLAEENRDLALMGAYSRGTDATVDEALDAHSAILAFVKQEFGHCVRAEDGLARLIEEFGA